MISEWLNFVRRRFAMDDKDKIPDVGERERFFAADFEDLAEEVAAATPGMDWSATERRPLDFLTDLLPDAEVQIPEEAKKHFRTAQHEVLLAVREFLDHWIDQTDPDKPAPQREVLMRSGKYR